MITAEQNETLTRVGPGTRMGALLRRYWHPIAGAEEMKERWTLRVRILGEDLVLFRDRSGRLGLIEEQCPHRRASLAYGVPEADGIRCPYHGWKFDAEGRCLEQPNETERHALKDKVATGAYPVQELGGLIFAYLGPAPTPLLPRWDGLVTSPAIRHIGKAIIPCNWLQIMENSVDPVHVEWLHGFYFEFVKNGVGEKVPFAKHHKKIAFDEFDYGIIKRRLLEGQDEATAEEWTVGHPLLFPNMLSVGTAGARIGDGGGEWAQYTFQIRVPRDDVSTLHFWFHAYVPAADMDVPRYLLDGAPVFDVPFRDKQGNFLTHLVHAQDIMVWTTQGEIADRSRENLGAADKGLSVYRRMLLREMERAEQGLDPKGVIRDPGKNDMIRLPLEHGANTTSAGFELNLRRHMSSFSPIADDLVELFTRSDKKRRLATPPTP